MTHSYVTWLTHTCDMTHSYTWHDAFIHVTWLIQTCTMTHLYMWHDLSIYVTWLVVSQKKIDTPHDQMWYGMAIMSTLLKIIGLFCKSYKRDYILQKRPITLMSLLIVATPYFPNIKKKAASFAKEPYKRDYILQKRPITLIFSQKESGIRRCSRISSSSSFLENIWMWSRKSPHSYVL